MFKFILLVFYCSVTLSQTRNCQTHYRFEKTCLIYDFKDPKCDPMNLKTCKIVQRRQNERKCPVKFCSIEPSSTTTKTTSLPTTTVSSSTTTLLISKPPTLSSGTTLSTSASKPILSSTTTLSTSIAPTLTTTLVSKPASSSKGTRFETTKEVKPSKTTLSTTSVVQSSFPRPTTTRSTSFVTTSKPTTTRTRSTTSKPATSRTRSTSYVTTSKPATTQTRSTSYVTTSTTRSTSTPSVTSIKKQSEPLLVVPLLENSSSPANADIDLIKSERSEPNFFQKAFENSLKSLNQTFNFNFNLQLVVNFTKAFIPLVKMSDVVYCAGKTCSLEYVDMPKCLHYLPTPSNSSCNIPCSLIGCDHEITHGICPLWICKDMPVVPTFPPITPTPTPSDDQHSSLFYFVAVAAIFFALTTIILAIVAFRKYRSFNDLTRYTVQLRRYCGIDQENSDERTPILPSEGREPIIRNSGAIPPNSNLSEPANNPLPLRVLSDTQDIVRAGDENFSISDSPPSQ